MQTLKYYKRGQGELDTSNFPDIVNQGKLIIQNLDEKTFVSLLVLNEYMETQAHQMITIVVEGYVAHLRGDKDLYPPSILYGMLNNFVIVCNQIQHEVDGGYKLKISSIGLKEIQKSLTDLGWGTRKYIGADSSVPKFCPEITSCATKVREGGKVIKLDYEYLSVYDKYDNLIIVDDILGGGATVQMLVDKLKSHNKNANIHLWTQYNEGIHSELFLNQFKSYYIGDKI